MESQEQAQISSSTKETGIEKIANVLNVNPIPEIITNQIVNSDDISKGITSTPDAEEDYEYVRNNLKQIIEIAKAATDSILMVASESDQPRAYEVVSELIKTTLEANAKLTELQKQMQDIRKYNKKSGNTTVNADNVTNNTIVVNTKDLQKMLKEGKK